jgi:RNA polymerase sigma-70 factor, ECF subfamily
VESQSELRSARQESSSARGARGDDYMELRAELVDAVRALCPRWLASRAEDLVQTAMVKIFELRRRSEQERELSSFYLKRVAYSALVDEIRRLERRRESPLEDDGGEPLPLPAATPGPDRVQASRELGEGIRDCVGRLLRPRKLAVTLYLQGVSVAEAARLLDWDLKHTRNLVYRGLGDLRRCLEGKGLHP